MTSEKIKIFTDFDGTISSKDTLVEVFDAYCRENWREIEKYHENGSIPQTESLKKEVELLQGKMEQFLEIIDSIKPIKGFPEFLEKVNENNIEMTILSGGFRTFIERFLKNSSIQFNGEIKCNDIMQNEAGWHIISNKSGRLCDKCPTCKSYDIFQASKKGYRTIYIGDGATDRCAASYADKVFATSWLKTYLSEKNIDFKPFETWHEIEKEIFK